MKKLLKNAQIINEGSLVTADVIIQGDRIVKVAKSINDDEAEIIDLSGKFLMPGVIDDQVHFREPGLTHKGSIYSEAKAAVAGGITLYGDAKHQTTSIDSRAFRRQISHRCERFACQLLVFYGCL